MKLKMQLLQYQAAFLLWALSVAGQTLNWTWTRTSSTSSASSTCPGCNVVAEEFFLSYPYSVSTISTSVTLTLIPYVTVYADGSNETEYKTSTEGSNGPVETSETKLTWEPFAGVTLTYPTTYVNFPSPYGGLDTSTNGACVSASAPLTLPTNSEQGLIYPVTISNWNTDLPWNVTQQMLDYLDSIPAVSQQFNGTKVGKCIWETYVTSTTSSVLPIQKVTVEYLTAVTAQAPIVVTSSGSHPTGTPTLPSLTPPTAFTRNLPTSPSTTTPPVVVSTSGATQSSPALGIASAILSIWFGTSYTLFLTEGSSSNPPTGTLPRTLVDPVATSTIIHSPSVSVVPLSDGAMSTMTIIPGYTTSSIIYSTTVVGVVNGTSSGAGYTGIVYTGRASWVRTGFFGWIFVIWGILGIVVL